MSRCLETCASGAGTSADGGSLGSPYSFADNTFSVDVSALGLLVTNPATGNGTLADIYLKPGSAISLFGFSEVALGIRTYVPVVLPASQVVVARGGVVGGDLASFTVKIPPLPTAANVYPNSTKIDCVTPNTNGLVVGSPMTGVGFAPGTTVGEIVDDQTIVVSNPCTVSSPSYASLAFSLPHAIPLNGQLLFSPCVLLNDVHADMYRSCGGDSPGWGGVTAVEPSWLDVSSRFAAFSFSWEINNSLTTASSLASSGTAAGVDFVDSDDSSSTLTVAGSGAIVAAVAAPSKPLFTPVAPPTGQFRVYKCKTCCETCFYLILFKAPTGFFLGAPTVTDRISANGTLAVTGTYSRTVIQAATPHGGGTTVTTTTVFSQTVGGTIAAQGFGTYFDYGLSCYPKGQSGINPQQGYGVVGGSIGELSRSLTSTGTETVTVSSGGGGSGPNPWSGPLILSLASISNGAGMTIDSCHPTGTHTINTTTTVKTVVATTSSGVTTTVTTTMDSDPPVITTTTVAGSHTAVGTTTTTQVTQTAITIGIA